MARPVTSAFIIVFSVFCRLELSAADRDRDFAGAWLLDEKQSDLRALPVAPGPVLTVTQENSAIRCMESDGSGQSGASWTYHTDGTATKYQVGAERRSSLTKWEGSALLINTIVTGSQNYAVMDRWKVSRDHNILTIRRQIQRGVAESEGVLVYRNQHPSEIEKPSVAVTPATPATPASPSAQPNLPAQRLPSQTPPEVVVPAGTKIPLALVNSLSTKHSGEGDRVYLETSFPVVIDGRIVIPRGSYVAGTVTEVKRPGRIKGKGELFLRFDSLTLPNGSTRDFRARLGGADAESGEFDREEGKIRSEGNKAGDAGTVAKTTGAGAAIGGIAGSAAGHAGMGVGVGAAAGAAAGLAAVLLSRGPDLVLPKGSTFEMVLDRNLRFKDSELGF
jgi:type IV secretion system protein VirB10